MKKKVLVIGSAVLDILASPVGSSGRWKEKQRIQTIRLGAGGDAVNQAVHLAALGFTPYLVSCTGADENARILRASLSERGVDLTFLREKKSAATGAALVLVNEQGERHTFSVQGAHSLLSKEDLPDPEILSRIGAVSLASIFSMPLLEQDGLLAFLKQAKEAERAERALPLRCPEVLL